MKINVDFNEKDKIPKYIRIVDAIVSDIEKGVLSAGDRLPSLNEACAEWYLSKDSVKRAYGALHQRGCITSMTRKGFFVTGTPRYHAIRVLIVAGQLTESVKELYDVISSSMTRDAILDVSIYNYKRQLLCQLLDKHVGDYHYFVMMPHLTGQDPATLRSLLNVPSRKLILIGNEWPETLQHGYRLRYGGERALREALASHLKALRKYNRLSLVLSEQDGFDADSIRTIRSFCVSNAFDFQIIDDLKKADVQTGQAYFLADSRLLLNLIGWCQQSGWTLGKNVGIVSFLENDYTRLLSGGVSVIGRPSVEVGKLVAQILCDIDGEEIPTSSLLPLHLAFRASC